MENNFDLFVPNSPKKAKKYRMEIENNARTHIAEGIIVTVMDQDRNEEGTPVLVSEIIYIKDFSDAKEVMRLKYASSFSGHDISDG
jgi:hypothetical protein